MDVLAAGEVLAPLARRCGGDFERFLTEIALGAEADALDPRADAVTLLTIHAAKGLEFGVVFVAGCERDLLPLWPGRARALEERRLLFVAMTRARTHLFLTCAARRRRHSAVTETGPSPFLASIDSPAARPARGAAPAPSWDEPAAPAVSPAGHHAYRPRTTPPFGESTWPVTQPPSGPSSQEISEATSSDVPFPADQRLRRALAPGIVRRVHASSFRSAGQAR